MIRISTSVVVVTLLLLGCSGQGNNRKAVRGQVTYKGEVLDQGRIEFLHATREGDRAGATIEDGSYQIPGLQGLEPGGRYRVIITSAEARLPASGDPMRAMSKTINKERIPPEFNSRSTQVVDIPVDAAEAVFDFSIP